MHGENSYSDFSAEAESLTSPHFDDERTLLSARQVVPLAEVAARRASRRTRRLALALGAFAVVMIGAVLFLRNARNETQFTTQSDSSTSVDAGQKASGGIFQTNLDANADANIQRNNPEVSGRPAARTPEKVAVKRKSTEVVPQPVTSYAPMDNYNWRTELEIRREARRRERREMRQRRRDYDGGIFRINDLFEGRSRP